MYSLNVVSLLEDVLFAVQIKKK
jgi:hypothetical protein